MIRKRQLLIGLIFTLAVSCGLARQVRTLDTGWRFVRVDITDAAKAEFDDSAWEAVSVPHTWNAQDGQAGKGYYRGPGWYRLHISLPKQTSKHRVFVRFGAASLVSDVYCNGKHVGHHRGGFAAFCYELTPLVKWDGDNVLAVRVSNEWVADVAPLEGDFNVFGGIYRPVELLITDAVCITPMDYGGPGVYLKQVKAEPDEAIVETTVKLSSSDIKDISRVLKVAVLDAEGKETAVFEEKVQVQSPVTAAAGTLKIQHPHLWNGKIDPYLYKVRVELLDGQKTVDVVEQPLGLRSFRVDAKDGFILNGKSYPLRGVCKHQDIQDCGWAMTQGDLEQDAAIMQEMGASCLRMAHYQHSEYLYDLCDKAGIAVWTEIPLVNSIMHSEGFANNARQQLTELIRQNYNHPSVICWGLYNELGHGGGKYADLTPKSLIWELNTLAHQEDPTRLTTAASNGAIKRFAGVLDIADLTAWNTYPGWYSNKPEDMGRQMDDYSKMTASKGVGISEYGAGASILHHQQNMAERPKHNGPWHPEEWQAITHEKAYAEIQKRPFIWGTFIWVLCDFASDGRNEGDRPGINDKGLVTHDGKIKKDAFYFYKAAWNKEPMVYITSRRHTPRDNPVTPVKVYSNCSDVELKINGVSLGVQKPQNYTCLWNDVNLKEGKNQIEVLVKQGGKEYRDSCDWDYQPAKETEKKN